MSAAPLRVLFVCTGNICRSPIAESLAIVRSQGRAAPIEVASAGTASWHVGEGMDPRAEAALRAIGVEPHAHRAQHADRELLASSDLIVGMDRKHLEILRNRVDRARGDSLVLLRRFDPEAGGAVDIADPYYGDDNGFASCVDIIDRSITALLDAIDAGTIEHVGS